jgi:hypothetical protein
VQVFWAPRPELHSLVGRGADGGSGRPWALTLPDRVPRWRLPREPELIILYANPVAAAN